MSEPPDPTRVPRLDDEVDGLDCFAVEGASSVDEADDAAVFEYEEVLPAVRVASLPAVTARQVRQPVLASQPEVSPAMRIAPPAWLRSWPGVRVTAVAVVLLLVGVIGMWMTMRRERPAASVAVAPVTPAARSQSSVPSVSPDTRSTAAAPAAPVATLPRDTATTASPRLLSTAEAPPVRRAAVPPATVSSSPAISSGIAVPDSALSDRARPAPLEAAPVAPIDTPVIVAAPEFVKAEPEAEAAAARASIITPPSDRASIERVLQQYRDAYDRLDAPSAAVIWPRVDTRALSRAFSTLASQDVSFERCNLAIFGVKASAQCTGEIRYVRRVGDQEPRVRRMSWSFAFERVSDRWQIAQVTAD